VRNTAMVITFSLISTLVIAMPASAGATMVVVPDSPDDFAINYDLETCEATVLWKENTALVSSGGYFDALSYSLSFKANTYTFGMELSAPLPDEGVALPSGLKHVAWTMWIDASPWHPVYNPTPSLFTIALNYDGANYYAVLIEGEKIIGTVLETLLFDVDGSQFQVQFSASSIGNLEDFWWCPCVHVWAGPVNTMAQWWVDTVDPGAYDGQIWWDIPWSAP
jgi:hypothetical protein